MRNYNSLTAVLYGLQGAKYDDPGLSDLWALLNISSNYSYYQVSWARDPGLPFLVPHVRKMHTLPSEEAVMNYVSQLLSYSASRRKYRASSHGKSRNCLGWHPWPSMPAIEWWRWRRTICI